MIKLLDLLRENVNPFYKDYGNYLFGGNASLYGKVVEKDTIGLGNHKVKAIIRKSYYDSIINSNN